VAVAAGLMATTYSTLSTYPHTLAYFNEASGGPENGYKHLLHSNFDWEQNGLVLKEWIEASGLAQEQFHMAFECPLLAPKASDTGSQDSRLVMRDGWVLVSAKHAVRPGSEWTPHLTNPTAKRIGYTYWAFAPD
jgi:hypothetical protein